MQFKNIIPALMLATLFMSTSCAQEENLDFGQPKPLSSQEKQQWQYLQSSLTSNIAAQNGFLTTYERILKYGVLPFLALGLLLKKGVAQLYPIYKNGMFVYQFDQQGYAYIQAHGYKTSSALHHTSTITQKHLRKLMSSLCNSKYINLDNCIIIESALMNITMGCVAAGLYVIPYMLIGKLFSMLKASRNQETLKKLLVEWQSNTNQIPVSLHQLITTLHNDAQAGRLTNEHCNKAIAALLAISAVALAQQ